MPQNTLSLSILFRLPSSLIWTGTFTLPTIPVSIAKVSGFTYVGSLITSNQLLRVVQRGGKNDCFCRLG